MTDTPDLSQTAPFPKALAGLVERVRYRDGWRIWLSDMDRGQGSKGLTLVIQRSGPDTYNPSQNLRVNHYFPVPPAAYDERSWQRWLFDRYLLVERHECMEFFRLADPDETERSIRPYAPSHGPGNDPYMIREVGTGLDQRTRFTGDVSPE